MAIMIHYLMNQNHGTITHLLLIPLLYILMPLLHVILFRSSFPTKSPPFQPNPPPPLQPDPGPLLQPTLQKKPYFNPSLPPPLHLPSPLQPYPDNIAPKETVLKKIIRAQCSSINQVSKCTAKINSQGDNK